MSLPYRRRGEVTGETHVGDFSMGQRQNPTAINASSFIAPDVLQICSFALEGHAHRAPLRRKEQGFGDDEVVLPLMAGVLAIGSVGCGSSTTQSQGGGSASSPTKTGNLNDLSNAMLLQGSDYPSVPGGYFETVSVHEQPAAGPCSRECAATALIREGGQTAAIEASIFDDAQRMYLAWGS